ncbi:hypothetical protein MMC27_005220 [Xylographa pallens]|nr:hypothetical protein [Xylographa pallens]
MADPEGPLPERLVPSIADNPFFNAAAIARFRLKDDFITKENEDTIVAERTNTQGELERGTFASTLITTARDTGVFDVKTEATGNDRRYVVASLLILNRYHYLSDEDMARFIISSRWSAKDPNRQILTEKLRKKQTTFQNHCLKVLITGLTDLVDQIGRDRWEQSTLTERPVLQRPLRLLSLPHDRNVRHPRRGHHSSRRHLLRPAIPTSFKVEDLSQDHALLVIGGSVGRGGQAQG